MVSVCLRKPVAVLNQSLISSAPDGFERINKQTHKHTHTHEEIGTNTQTKMFTLNETVGSKSKKNDDFSAYLYLGTVKK